MVSFPLIGERGCRAKAPAPLSILEGASRAKSNGRLVFYRCWLRIWRYALRLFKNQVLEPQGRYRETAGRGDQENGNGVCQPVLIRTHILAILALLAAMFFLVWWLEPMAHACEAKGVSSSASQNETSSVGRSKSASRSKSAAKAEAASSPGKTAPGDGHHFDSLIECSNPFWGDFIICPTD